MKFNKFQLLVIVLLVSSPSFSQYKKIIKGKKHYDNYLFQKSIRTLEKVDEKTIEVNRLLADAYRKIGDTKKAEEIYAAISKETNKSEGDLFNYASVLMMNKKYDKAEEVYLSISKLSETDGRLKTKNSNSKYYLDLLKDRDQYTIKNLEINSEEQDFAPTYYKNKLVITSSREGVVPIKRTWERNGLSFLDMYIAGINKESKEITTLEQFNEKSNFRFHDGPAAFNSRGNYMVFTRNNYNEKGENNLMGLQLYETWNVAGKWKKPEPLHFNDKNYSVGQPTLTSDGKVMYFASNMPGGYGGTDLYKVERGDDGAWGKPVNLGSKINTEGNEMFPFIHFNREMLFFASDGHLGLGGLDVFVLQIRDDYISDIQNIGVPVNSSKDDFSFILDEKKKHGYFASNRDEGKGSDDIYAYDLLKPFNLGRKIVGVVVNEFAEPLPDAKVLLLDDERNIIEKYITNEQGEYQFNVVPNTDYVLNGSKDNYFVQTIDVSTAGESDIIPTEIELYRILKVALNGLVTDNENKSLLSDVTVMIVDNADGKTDTLTTDYKGEYSLDYGGKKLNTNLDFLIRFEKEGYLSKSVEYKELVREVGKYDILTGMDKVKLGVDVAKLLNLKPIYFDFGKFDIRPDAAIELDKMVQVLLDNTTIEIELGAHTDCRGSDKANEKLSDKRAKASADYIKSRIDDPSRIYGKGYGEKVPVADCGCLDCTEEQHQLNRRTEFKIVKINDEVLDEDKEKKKSKKDK